MKRSKLIKKLKSDEILLMYLNSFFTFVALLISFCALQINIKYDEFMKTEVAASFNINVTDDNVAELIKLKGFVNNLKFTKFDVLTIILDDNYILKEKFTCENVLEDNNVDNKWFYKSSCNNIGERFEKEIRKMLNKYDSRISFVYSDTYYQITYFDYQNKYLTETYFFSYDQTMSFLENQDEVFDKIQIYTYISKDLNTKDISKQVKKYYFNYS